MTDDTTSHVEAITQLFLDYMDKHRADPAEMFTIAAVTASNIAQFAIDCGFARFDGNSWDFMTEYSRAFGSEDVETFNRLMDWEQSASRLDN